MNKVLACIFFSCLVWVALFAQNVDPELSRGIELLHNGDYAAAAKIILPFAEKGDLTAKKQLAIMHFHGQGVPRSVPKAFALFTEVLKASGDKEAYFYAGMILFAGHENAVKKDPELGSAYMKKAAEHSENSPGIRTAQYVCGKSYRADYNISQFLYYMELAAGQNMYEAWMELGDYYSTYRYSTNDLKAKFCFDAARRIKADAQADFRAALTAFRLREFQRCRRLMQSASEKGSAEADKFLTSGKLDAAERKWSYFYKNQHLWPYTPDAFINTGSHKMLLLPPNPAIKMAGWDFVTNRERFTYAWAATIDTFRTERAWISEEYIFQPLRKNLCDQSTALQLINEKYYPGFLAFMERSPYKPCSKAEIAELTAFLGFGKPHLTPKYFAGDKFWKLRQDLFFYVHVDDEIGSKYQFILRKADKFFILFTFDTPPDAQDAAMVAGFLANDPAALNNAAVELARDTSGVVTGDISDPEAIFKKLADAKHAVGTYNLAMYHQNRGRHADAEKYFALAEKFNGSSVISYHTQRPEIFDRNGGLLVKNRFYLPKISSRTRIYLRGGNFIPDLLGHISASQISRNNGESGRITEDGMGGIEQILDEQAIYQNIYLTVEPSIQLQLDKLVGQLSSADPMYAYASILTADGELIAASQTPGFDFDKRESIRKSPSAVKYLTAFLPVAYLFPVPDQWMKLLGSSSNDSPDNKVRFKFHIRQKLFPAEAQGLVPGVNCRINEDAATLSGQSTSMLKFLCAYIGTVEKSPIPDVKYFTFAANTPVNIAENVRWVSFYRPPDGIIVNALGTIKSTTGKKLYIFVRFVPMERQYGKKVPADAIRAAAKKADAAEKMIREFKFETTTSGDSK